MKRARAPVKCVLGTNHLGSDFGARLRGRFGPEQLELIEAMSDDSAHSCEAEHAAAIEDADVFFGWPSGATFAAAKRLRWIACPGAGVDKIVKYDSIKSSPVLLTNAPGTHVVPMAEHVIGSMIALAHRFDEAEVLYHAVFGESPRCFVTSSSPAPPALAPHAWPSTREPWHAR